MAAMTGLRRDNYHRGPRPTTIRAEDIPAPADAVLIPVERRPWLLGWCTRCGQLKMVPIGGSEGLCAACNAGEVVDRGQAVRAGVVRASNRRSIR